jgi:hypothetical protein
MSNSLAIRGYVDEFSEEIDSNMPVKPERNLLSAVLARAICDAFGPAHCERHVVRSARQWLFGKICISQSFSFGWVATNLDLDPLELQKNLRRLENKPEEIQERLSLLR